MRLIVLLTAALAAVLLAGCSDGVSNGPDGQSASGGGNLAYNGASNGTQTDTFESDGSCDLVVSANLGSGRVVFTLTGAGSSTSKEVSGPGQYADTAGTLSGAAGTWTLKAERSSNSYGTFSGQYAVTADC